MRATSRAGSALAATTLAAFFAPGDAAEVTVKISYPDRDAGSTAARVLVATLVTLAVSVLVWMVLRRSASSTTRTSTSTTTAEQDVVNDNEEIDGNNGWEVLTGDDDEEDTTAGAPAVGGHERSAEGQAGSSAASRERPAVARRAGEAARASARQVAPRLADSRRLDAVTNSSPESRGEMARRFRDAVPPRRAADRAKTTRPLSHRSEATAGS